MDDPIKIVWKYKNLKNRVQYNTYIFIGNKVPAEIMKILESITSLNFYDTIVQINKSDYNKMESFYGEKWYEKFFNVYHIDYTIDLIKDSFEFIICIGYDHLYQLQFKWILILYFKIDSFIEH